MAARPLCSAGLAGVSLRMGMSVWLVLAVCVGCAAPESFALEASYFNADIDGTAALDSSAGGLDLGFNKHDVVNDLGVDGDVDAVQLGVAAGTEYGRIRFDVFSAGSSGSGVLQRRYGDIPQGTSVQSEMTFRSLRGLWVYDLLDSETFRIAPGIGLNFFDMEMAVSSDTPDAFERTELVAPVPMLYVEAGATWGRLDVRGIGGWMDIELPDADGRYWDADARASFRVADSLEVIGGYRYFDVDATGEASGRDFEADLNIEGWYVGGALVF